MRLVLFAAACLLLSPITTRADDYIVSTLASYHFNRETNYNERNYGLGWEHKYSEETRTGAGFYKNSFYRTTGYVFAAYTPLEVLGTHWGGIGGFVSGYEEDRLSMMIGVFGTKEWKNAGINVLLNPAAVAVQVKWRVK